VDKAIDDGVAWSRGEVMPITLHDDVFSSLNFSFAIRAAGGEVGEESLSVFSNGVWPVVMRVKRAHKELVNPITGSHEPPLA